MKKSTFATKKYFFSPKPDFWMFSNFYNQKNTKRTVLINWLKILKILKVINFRKNVRQKKLNSKPLKCSWIKYRAVSQSNREFSTALNCSSFLRDAENDKLAQMSSWLLATQMSDFSSTRLFWQLIQTSSTSCFFPIFITRFLLLSN